MSPPEIGEAALVIIDAQDEYGPGGRLELPGLPAALDRIEDLLSRAREKGATIVHVVHRGNAGGLFDPATGGKVLSQVTPMPGEKIVDKTLPNSFAGTDLEEHLRNLGNPPLILVGFMTHMCVSSTARAALDLGLSTTIAADATATRPLPSPLQDKPISAHDLQRASLAAMADRFSLVIDTGSLV